MCKKQIAVSHSSTESEIISLDTGLRLDGLLALELWDLIVSVLGNVSRVSDGSGKPERDVHKRHKSHKKIDVMENIDSVPSNVQSSRQEALLYVFEDNEAVIKMIIKGRSPTMRHVSRTHRVALDWLFDRISSTSSNPVRTSYGYQDPGKSVASDDRSGKPERPPPPGYSKEDYGQSWSSQEWKSGAAAHDRSGKPEKTSWDMMQQVAPHREEPLLDGNAHSVRYGEMIHDGSGKLEKVNSQEGADSKIFVMGSDAAEFVNKVKDQVRSRQKRMSNVAESGEEHSIIW